MLTIPERIELAASRPKAITFVGGDDPVRVPWSDLFADASVLAAGLQARGIKPGDHVAVLGPTSRPLVTTIEAIWLAGGTVVVLPLPMRMGSIEEFVAQTRRRISNADIALVVVDPDLAPYIDRQSGDAPMVGYQELVASGTGRRRAPVAPDLERLAILQFTSGSTSDPKGVMLPHRAVCSNLDAMA